MKEAQPVPLLTGTVEMDETYTGGHHHGACPEGRGDPKKQIVSKRLGNTPFRREACVVKWPDE
jgi:hypothetical protein